MWSWIRTPRGSTTTTLVVAVILALLWFDPWTRPFSGHSPAETPAPLTSSSSPAPASGPTTTGASSQASSPPSSPAAPGVVASPPAGAPGATASSTVPDAANEQAAISAPSTASSGPGKTTEGAQPAGTQAADRPAATPGFDIVRVEPDGSAVVAGRGEPGSEVVLLDGDKPVARAQVDAGGQFAILPPALQPGDHTLALQTSKNDRAPVRSPQSVAVSIARQANTRPLVALLSPDKPAEVLSDGGTSAAAGNGGGARPAAGTPPSALAIQTVEARQAGQFAAAGVAKPGTSNRVYLNGSFVAEVTAGANGRWSVEVQKGMTPGRYQVRADQVEPASGKVVSRVEVPFDYPAGAPGTEGKPTRVAQAASAAASRDAGTRAGAKDRPSTGAPPVTAQAPAAQTQPMSAPTQPSRAQQAVPTSPAFSSQATQAAGVAQSLRNAGTQATGKDRPGTGAPTLTAQSPTQASRPQLADATSGAASSQATVASAPSQAPALSDGAASGSTTPPQASSDAESETPQGSASAIVPDLKTKTVERGESLWRISRKLLGRGMRYTEIYASNAAQIKDPALIYPGQVFVVPTQRVN